MAELHSLARYCKFGVSMNDLLRDRIAFGINDKKHPMTTSVSRENAHLGFSIGYRCGHGECKEERDRTTNPCTKTDLCTEVYKITTTNCYRCGNSGHTPDHCRFRHMKCLTCGKTGQIQSMCRSG